MPEVADTNLALEEWGLALRQLERLLRLFDRRMNQLIGLAFLVFLVLILRNLRELLSNPWNLVGLGFIVVFGLVLIVPAIRESMSPAAARAARRAAHIEQYYGALLAQARLAEIAQRLAGGEIDGNEMLPHLHKICRWAYPRLRDPSKLTLLKRVGNNLKWYTGPPRDYAPIWTIMLFLTALFGAAVLVDWACSGKAEFANMLPWFILFALKPPLYGTEGWALVLHLREAWEGEGAAAEFSGDAETTTTGGAELRRKMALVLNQAEQDLSDQPSALGIVIAFIGALLCAPTLGGWTFAVFAMLVILTVGSRDQRSRRAYRERLRLRLEASSVAERLAAGDYEVSAIRQYVPKPFRFWLSLAAPPKAYAGQLRQSLWLMAYNLDWYLKPPARLVRLCWVTTSLAILLGLAALVFLFRDMVLSQTGTAPEWLGHSWKLALLNVPVVLALLAPAVVYAANVTIWIDELLAHLRRRMTAEA
jgi:hypothetical protein